MVLGKLPVPGRPTNLDSSMTRAYCTCSRCGWWLFGHFFSRLSFLSLLSPSLWETARYRLKYCLKGPLSPKQPTNQLKGGNIMKLYTVDGLTQTGNATLGQQYFEDVVCGYLDLPCLSISYLFSSFPHPPRPSPLSNGRKLC